MTYLARPAREAVASVKPGARAPGIEAINVVTAERATDPIPIGN